jgi:glycosyltransferase involved in cell wall biosynthesis
MNKKVTIFTGLVDIDENLVGTAVIYKEIADIFLKEGYEVVMIVPRKANLKDSSIEFKDYDKSSNEKAIKSSSLVVFGAYPPVEPLFYAYQKNKIIITYLWSIGPIGSLEFKDFKSQKDQASLHRYITASYNLSLLLSDKIFCRDANIRNLVLGSLISLGRVNLENYKKDRKLNKLIEVASFGLDKKAPVKKKDIYRVKYEGIERNDFLLMWNGGIWNWNDAETLIRAIAKLKNPKIKLIFQGFKHPDKNKKLSLEAKKALLLAEKLKLKDRRIFFSEEWLPHKERADFLLESDLGVVSSPDIPEANLFFKTRIYDYIWSGLPMIVNDCEAFADIVEKNELGLISKTGDPDDWARNIEILSENSRLRKKMKANIVDYRKKIFWEKTLKPVKNFIENPHKLNDKNDDKNFLIKNNIDLNINIIDKYE